MLIVATSSSDAVLAQSAASAGPSPSAVGGGSAAAIQVAQWPRGSNSPMRLEQTARNRSKGALVGGGVGLVLRGLLGGLSVETDSGGGLGGSLIEGPATGAAVLLGGLAGAAIGAILGATVFAPSQRAADNADPALSLQILPRTSPHRLGLHVRWASP